MIFFVTSFSRVYKMKTRTYIKILRQSSLNHDMEYVKPHVWEQYIKRDIPVKKISRKNTIYSFIWLYFFK